MAKIDVPEQRMDAGLLTLRLLAGLSLLLTFGLGKLIGYALMVASGKPLSTAGLAPLIQKMGFPFPVLLGFYAALCESIGALLVTCGLFTRFVSVCVLLSMSGAFYTSIRLGEEPLRAALYMVMFAALALAGPGRFSIDAKLQSRKGTGTPAEKR